MNARQLTEAAAARGAVFTATPDGYVACTPSAVPGYRIHARKRFPSEGPWCGWWDLTLRHPDGSLACDEPWTVEHPEQVAPVLVDLDDRARYCDRVAHREPAPVEAPRSTPGDVPPFTARAATTRNLFTQDTSDPDRTFRDRAAAVRYARQLSERGTPCDVYDGAGDLVYTRSMDVAAQRAQLGLFS